MRELQAGERVSVTELGPGASARLVLRVRGRAVVEDLPREVRVWAVLVGPGPRVLASAPQTGGPGGERGLAAGEAGVAGIILRPELVYGETHRVCTALTWQGTAGPLTLEVRVDGSVVARVPLPETGSGGGAMLLASVYRRGPGTRLWVHAERVRSVPALEALLDLEAGALQRPSPGAGETPSPALPRGTPEPSPAAPVVPDPGPPAPPPFTLNATLARVREAWAVLIAAPRDEAPALPTVQEREGENLSLPPRTARVLAELGGRLRALREVLDEEGVQRQAGGMLLSPEDARRRARLAGLEQTHARVKEEAATLTRRKRQLDHMGQAGSPEITAVENAIEGAVQALARALDQEVRDLLDGPLQESRLRLQSEARFLEDLGTGREPGELDLPRS